MKRFCMSAVAAVWFLVVLATPGLVTASSASGGDGAKKAILKGPITYAEIGDRIMSAHGFIVGGAHEADENGLLVLSNQEKRKIVFSILDEYKKMPVDPDKEQAHDSLRLLIKDLELFYQDGDRHDQTLFSQIDYTRTMYGEAALAWMLTHPTTDSAVLEKRQKLVKLLLEDEDVCAKVDSLLKNVRASESAVLSFWKEEDKTKKEVIKNLYFSTSFLKRFNNSAPALEFLNRSNNFWSLVWPLTADIFYGSLMPCYLKLCAYERDERVKTGLESISIPWGIYFQSIGSSLLASFKQLYNPISNISNWKAVEAGKWDDDIKKYVAKGMEPEAKKWLIRWFELGFVQLPLTLWQKWQSIKNVQSNFKVYDITMKGMQAQLMGVGAFTAAAAEFDSLAKSHAEFEQGIASYANLPVVHNQTAQLRSFGKLIKLLKTDTFKGKPSFFSYTGRILLTLRLMQENKNRFAGTMEVIGELDACLSIAKLIKKHKDTRVHFSFVQYLNQPTPSLHMKQMWNPMVNVDTVVPNDVELGVAVGVRNMILTGSNTGGKSTLLKGLLFSVLLAQTFGIAPCDDMIFTPYMYIGSSLNIVDNTAGGKSLFQAEVDRAVGLMSAAAFYQKQGPCLLVIDEMFRGTGPDRAEEETYNCAKRLASLDGVIMILATHFKKHVTKLQEETGGICKNYKIEVLVDEKTGQLVHTYRLEEGISMSNIAGNILNNAFEAAKK